MYILYQCVRWSSAIVFFSSALCIVFLSLHSYHIEFVCSALYGYRPPEQSIFAMHGPEVAFSLVQSSSGDL